MQSKPLLNCVCPARLPGMRVRGIVGSRGAGVGGLSRLRGRRGPRSLAHPHCQSHQRRLLHGRQMPCSAQVEAGAVPSARVSEARGCVPVAFRSAPSLRGAAPDAAPLGRKPGWPRGRRRGPTRFQQTGSYLVTCTLSSLAIGQVAPRKRVTCAPSRPVDIELKREGQASNHRFLHSGIDARITVEPLGGWGRGPPCSLF